MDIFGWNPYYVNIWDRYQLISFASDRFESDRLMMGNPIDNIHVSPIFSFYDSSNSQMLKQVIAVYGRIPSSLSSTSELLYSSCATCFRFVWCDSGHLLSCLWLIAFSRVLSFVFYVRYHSSHGCPFINRFCWPCCSNAVTIFSFKGFVLVSKWPWWIVSVRLPDERISVIFF